ncbi:MAG TPA: nitronate monooxygenase [Tepidisphaeraceae bacterium]|nr:nitronate monooxygenase [Tepidisphaeraceae bacterium]
MPHPQIIQGGMGVGVSGWALARAVSQQNQLGVVSGTALAIIMARRLQLGDVGGHMRRGMAHFPIPGMAERILAKYYIAGGKPANQPFKAMPVPSVQLSTDLLELTVVSNFVEIFLAKEGHKGLVGVNYLEKVQLPALASLFGAMLAGVDYVLMGAGVPRAIPGVLDRLANGETAQLRIDVPQSQPGEEAISTLDPQAFCGGQAPKLKRPFFLAIVSSATLASVLARKASGRVDGFVVEGKTAGGHNAPPRGPLHLNERGEPIYSARDIPDVKGIRELGLPFWLAGSYADPERLAEAKQLGAAGVQVGTAFAFCEESGILPELKRRVIEKARAGSIDVFTDPLASPTGFPFKVLRLENTLSDAEVYAQRKRYCDVGYLRSAYRKSDGSVGFRCPAEPVEQYLLKEGSAEDTCNRKCACSGLMATVGLGQIQPNGKPELPLVTAGEDAARVARFLKGSAQSYTAADVIRYILADQNAPKR